MSDEVRDIQAPADVPEQQTAPAPETEQSVPEAPAADTAEGTEPAQDAVAQADAAEEAAPDDHIEVALEVLEEDKAPELDPHVEFALEVLEEEVEPDPDVEPVPIEEAIEELEQDDGSDSTGPLPEPLELELAKIKQAQEAEAQLAIMPPAPEDEEAQVEPMNAPGRETIPVAARTDSDTFTGQNEFLRWGARSDVGLVRTHNEDSLLVEAPLFCVCDGMGGHAAGEVASSIAVRSIAENSPRLADDVMLGVAIEKANVAVIEAVERGEGKPGMGCTATAAVIVGNKMSIAHVGDSRIYILHQGSLVRVTRDHSFVEELVDSGEITVGEARLHPSRSIITRALGSDRDMYADHFTLDIQVGDRIIICSDGLSSMISDSHIESVAVSNVTPQGAVDNLVADALAEGGHDNITAIAIDVLDDGLEKERRRQILKRVVQSLIVVLMITAIAVGIVALVIRNSYYIANNHGYVAIYQGAQGDFLGMELSHLQESTTVELTDLPEALQDQIVQGISVASLEEARNTVESYRQQIEDEKAKAQKTADEAKNAGATPAPAPVSSEPNNAEADTANGTENKEP